MKSRLTLIFLLALLLRLIVAGGLNVTLERLPDRDFLIAGDADGYWKLATKIVAGEDFSLYQPPRYVMRMPGFPGLLAVSISLFGDSIAAARFFLAFVTSFSVFPAYWLGYRAWNRMTGTLAASLLACLPIYVGFSVLILSESIFATLILWNVWALVRWREGVNSATSPPGREGSSPNVSRPWKHVVFWSGLAGIFASLAVYVRPSWLLFPVAVLPALVIVPRRELLKQIVGCLLMFACLLAPLVPWGMRNQQVTGHFVLTTLWMGPSLYDGLHPGATGESDMTFFEEDRLLERMNEYEMNRFYKDAAWQFASENPVRAIELGMIKLGRYWSLWPNADQFQDRFLLFISLFSNLFLFAGAICGLWVMRRRVGFVFLCTLPIVYFAALHTLFVSSLRYRLPAEYPLLVIAAVGWQAVFREWLSRRRSAIR